MDDERTLSADLDGAASDPPAEEIELVYEDDSPGDTDVSASDDGELSAAGDSDDDHDDDSDDPDETDVALIRQRAKELEEQNRELLAERQRVIRAQAEQQHRARFARIDSDYEQAQIRIEREAEDAPDPAKFVRVNMARLNDWRQGERDKLHQEEVGKLRNAYAAASQPNFARQVGQVYKLTPKEIDELTEIEPRYMESEAKKIVARRSEIDALKAQLDQMKREIAAGRAAPAAVTPGTGRGGSRRVKAGSLDHLQAIYANHGR